MLNLSLLIALLSASFLLFYSGPDAYAIRSLREFWNLGHVLYFGLLVYLLWYNVDRLRLSRKQIWVLSLLLTLVWGVLIEVLQYGTVREADVMDISRDFCGTLLALSFVPGLMLPAHKLIKFFFRILVAGFALFHLSPLLIALIDETIAQKQFPVLSNFETPFELNRWKGSANQGLVSAIGGRQGGFLQIEFDTQRYSGVGMAYFPTDWRGHQALNLEIFYADSDPLQLTFKLYDARHRSIEPTFLDNDRFHLHYQLTKGWNPIQINLADIKKSPENRTMNMAEIVSISFFSSRLKQSKTIYLDRIMLSK